MEQKEKYKSVIIKNQMEEYGFEVYIQEFDICNLIENPIPENYFNLNLHNSEAIAVGHNVIADLKTYDPEKKTLVFQRIMTPLRIQSAH